MAFEIALINAWEAVIILAKRLYLENTLTMEECDGMINKATAEIKDLVANG